jgi:hypothetical protein
MSTIQLQPISQLQQFRKELYQIFEARADALMDLVDALCASPWAQSVVELSLSPLFRREYSSISDAIAQVFQPSEPEKEVEERRAWEQQIAQLIGGYLPAPQGRKFWLFGTDGVSVPRPYAQTLEDRTMVHQPTPVKGNKPVTIGHRYSVAAFLPEKEGADAPPWVVPLMVRRVTSEEKAPGVGAEQLTALLGDATQPFAEELCVPVADSEYSHVDYLGSVSGQSNLVNVVRVAENRVFYRPAEEPEEAPGPGHPLWYGEAFE